ncbi:MAG: acyl-CoA dehydrogenase family protein, partial [Deltaproteobacteria bacterium]|nr:acyl-CoA dehydrogenase family protein [Deltaproteobacteria bacterium]
MIFELTEEQQMIQEMVRGFVEKEVRPVASRLDREGIYPRD